ncbi:MAG: alpha/beta fold hydrolase [Myxococcota bacterium]|nr:alpha/beta fold hydrolase [Myxococcota bacterium]
MSVEEDAVPTDDTVPLSPDVQEPPSTVKLVEWPACSDGQTPIVMVHGSFASGDTWVSFARRFMANGYCPASLITFDYNSTFGPAGATEDLDAVIDDLLVRTGQTQVDLIGHSLGGAIGYDYLADASRAAKIRRYVHVGASKQDAPADADTPMLNLASTNDTIVAGNDGITGAENVILTVEDHYAVATSAAAFTAVYSFLTGTAPETTDWSLENGAIVAGKALTFAENQPLAGGTVAVWEVDSTTAERLKSEPDMVLELEADGAFGPLEIDPAATYEWVVRAASPEALAVHYFREPLTGPNPFLYLRSVPTADSLVGSLLASIPLSDSSGFFVLFSESRAIVSGDDSLTMNGLELATDTHASRENCTIAIFIYDENENGQTEATPVELFAALPFFSALDYFAPVSPPETVVYQLNERSLAVRTVPGEDGAVIAVFD